MKFLLLILGFVALAMTNVPAATPKALLEQLRAEIRSELKVSVDKLDGENKDRVLQLEELLLQRLPPDALDELSDGQLADTLGEIQNLSKSPAAAKLAKRLQAELRTTRVVRENEHVEASAKLLREVGQVMLKAEKASELDAPLAEVLKAVRKANRFPPEGQNVAEQQALAMRQLLTRWQDLLLAAEEPKNPVAESGGAVQRGPYQGSGFQRVGANSAGFDDHLDNFLVQLHDVLPRSTTLERLAEIRKKAGPEASPINPAVLMARTREVIQGITKLEEIKPAIAELDRFLALQNTDGRRQFRPTTLYMLGQVSKAYDELKAGAVISLTSTNEIFSPSYSFLDMEDLALVKRLLLLYGLPRAIGVAEDRGPTPGEEPAAYLARMSAEAQKAQDWPLLSRVLETATNLRFTAVANYSDVPALRQMLGAIKLEEAGQLSSAVGAYLSALKQASAKLPGYWVGERLKAIRAKAPEDYRIGVELAERPDPNAALIERARQNVLQRMQGSPSAAGEFPAPNERPVRPSAPQPEK